MNGHAKDKLPYLRMMFSDCILISLPLSSRPLQTRWVAITKRNPSFKHQQPLITP